MAKARRSAPGGILERVYCILSFVNKLHYPVPRKGCVGSVISLLPLTLHINKRPSEISHFLRELSHGGLVIALISGMSVFQRPVGLPPRHFTAIGSDGPSQSIGANQSEGMEQSIVRGAYDATQFGLAWSATIPCPWPRRPTVSRF